MSAMMPGARLRPHIAKLAMAGACLAIGAALAAPTGLAALAAGAVLLAFVAYCAARPDTALCMVVFLLVVIPQYAVLYLPGMPALPLSLGPLGILGGLLVLTALTARTPLQRPRSPVTVAFLLYGLALLIATMVAGNKDAVMLLLRTYAIPVLLFTLVLHYAPTGEKAVRAMNWLLAATCIAAIYAVLEFSLKRNELLEKLVINADIDVSLKDSMAMFYLGTDAFSGDTFGQLIYRCFSFFTNPLEFGTFMTMVYPFALVHAVSVPETRLRRRYALAAVLCAIGIVLSFSRGPILALVLSTFGVAVFLPRLRRIVLFSTAGLLLCFAAAWPVIGDRIQSRLNEVDNVTVRFKLWDVGAHVFTDHPLFGVGLSQYAKYEDGTIRSHRIGPFYEYGGSIEKIATVDNHLIQLAAETGLVGLIAYGALLAVFFATLYRVWRRHPVPFARHTALALAAGGCNYLLNGLTITSYVLFIITMIFTFFLAITASLGAEVAA